MIDYRSPLRDMRFVIYDVLDFESHFARLEGRELITREFLDQVLDEAARFADQELFPLNRVGDEEGCRLENGEVSTPAGFKEAYQAFAAGGWSGMTGDPAYGGQGLPDSVSLLVEEMMTSANTAWTMYPVLSHGTVNALSAHGTEAQKQTFLTRLLSGEWTGTMCLTEPHAGSDVGILRTKAEPQADGSYAITGTKIFISAGDHDMAENIVHLVLARLPDAPDGTKGISLFVVPKVCVNEDGSLGERNAVSCGAIEEKMGIHGNATCVLNFDGATGYLVGAEHDGMRCMFTMMNAARIVVGVQGLGLMEAAYQGALAYANERLQMRSLSGPKNPDGPADPIIVHPDVRRMLLTQKAFIEGGRALTYFTAMQGDLAAHGPDPATRERAEALLDFLTPILKAFVTETAFEAANHAVQVHGGHGFIRETGVEQYVRDSRITLIYEGTTQIQALDLIGRKVLRTQGAAMLDVISDMKTLAEATEDGLTDLADELTRIADEWGEAALGIAGRAAENPEEVGAASVDFLMYSGYAVLAYLWLRMANVASGRDDAFSRGKVATARFFFARLLPRAEAHRRAMEAGADSLMNIETEAFSHL